VQVPVGMSLLEAAHANDVDLEGTLDVIVKYCDFLGETLARPSTLIDWEFSRVQGPVKGLWLARHVMSFSR
jgi:hypothetical protein